jgi:hypothetical protein
MMGKNARSKFILTALSLAVSVTLGLACGGGTSRANQALSVSPTQTPSSPTPQPTRAETDQLDVAIREASDYFNKNLTIGNKLVVLNIQSDFPVLSEYIIEELISNTVNDRIFKIVDRKQLDAIRNELSFQMSGEVDDNSAQRAGQILGAQIIITGAVSKFSDIFRLVVRALDVETAQIIGQFNRNIPNGPMITAIAQNTTMGYGVATTPTSQPSPTTLSPTPRTVKAPPPSSGSSGGARIFIATSPAGADIYIGDRFIGKSNSGELQVPIGIYQVRFLKGDLDKIKTITFKTGTNPTIFVPLK